MLELLFILAIAGFIVWLVTTYVPMPPAFKSAIVGVAIILMVLYVCQAMGWTNFRMPR